MSAEHPCPLGCDAFGGHTVYRLSHFSLRMDGTPRASLVCPECGSDDEVTPACASDTSGSTEPEAKP
jgi:hypothetical protein